ncbi:hypothetical protein L798_12729 [Zootermopsis nevadensis]|uniref:Uncharacterized protein n=1 Tax=Zootermopsis nevadensis TaxID=136037 RepID=A0A067RS11_ZOONE|nr:hypothetical protein L798_12729 [Zootermopsis nevadensis]
MATIILSYQSPKSVDSKKSPFIQTKPLSSSLHINSRPYGKCTGPPEVLALRQNMSSPELRLTKWPCVWARYPAVCSVPVACCTTSSAKLFSRLRHSTETQQNGRFPPSVNVCSVGTRPRFLSV